MNQAAGCSHTDVVPPQTLSTFRLAPLFQRLKRLNRLNYSATQTLHLRPPNLETTLTTVSSHQRARNKCVQAQISKSCNFLALWGSILEDKQESFMEPPACAFIPLPSASPKPFNSSRAMLLAAFRCSTVQRLRRHVSTVLDLGENSQGLVQRSAQDI